MELGALVFAKMRGFPAWPAQVARAPVGGRCATRHMIGTDIDSPRQSACIICAANHSTIDRSEPLAGGMGKPVDNRLDSEPPRRHSPQSRRDGCAAVRCRCDFLEAGPKPRSWLRSS